MKKNDWILAAAILAAAVLLGVFAYRNRSAGHYVVVKVDGEEFGSYDLAEDRIIDINGTNQLEIADGKAFMIAAECPDQICVHMVPISHAHELIVCMPNKVTVEAFEK